MVEEDSTQVRPQRHMSHTPAMAARYYEAVFVACWKSRSITMDIPIWQKAIWLVTKLYLPRLGVLVNLCGLVIFSSCTWTITSSVWREPHAVTTLQARWIPYFHISVRKTCYNINYTEVWAENGCCDGRGKLTIGTELKREKRTEGRRTEGEWGEPEKTPPQYSLLPVIIAPIHALHRLLLPVIIAPFNVLNHCNYS